MVIYTDVEKTEDTLVEITCKYTFSILVHVDNEKEYTLSGVFKIVYPFENGKILGERVTLDSAFSGDFLKDTQITIEYLKKLLLNAVRSREGTSV